MGKLEVKHEIVVSGNPLMLADIRALVAQCEGMSDDSPVTVQRSGDQRDGDWGSVTVHGKAQP